MGIDAREGYRGRAGVLTDEPSQTLVVEGTVVDVARQVMLGLLAEDLFLLLGSRLCLIGCFHVGKGTKKRANNQIYLSFCQTKRIIVPSRSCRLLFTSPKGYGSCNLLLRARC